MFGCAGTKYEQESRRKDGSRARFSGSASWFGATVSLLVLMFSTLHGAAPKPPPAFEEYELKAAILAKLPSFTTWPDNGAAKGRGLTLGILGQDPFGSRLKEMVRDPQSGTNRMHIRLLASIEEALECNVIFIGRSARDQVAGMVELLQGRHVLTVADMPDFVENGGMINLVIVEQKIRLELNLQAVHEAGLRLSTALGKYSVKTIPKTGKNP